MLFDLQGLSLCIFVLFFSEKVNEYYIECVFDPQTGVVMILGGYGVQGFLYDNL